MIQSIYVIRSPPIRKRILVGRYKQGKQNSLFPLGPVIKCLLTTPLIEPNFLPVDNSCNKGFRSHGTMLNVRKFRRLAVQKFERPNRGRIEERFVFLFEFFFVLSVILVIFK